MINTLFCIPRATWLAPTMGSNGSILMRKSHYNRRSTDSAVRRETKAYPSNHDGTGGSLGKTHTVEYTGTVVKGVALLHKQAYSPVTEPIKTDPKRQ